MQLDPLGMIVDPGAHGLGPVDRVLVHHQVHLGREVLDQPVQEADEHPGGEGTVKYSLPVGLIALMALTPNRLPVLVVVGVCPFNPQVRPDR